ncbi:methyltransferase domain-containing protein [Aquihabitans sp. G128]|uniref:bifunctional glycosyltransferase/class I SAM-dependent methyltransferase n=1 Tax=Aquihabitans sp. G128 TaxID=2849779 RepID=UPI001C238982|nr:bifunctional glycosyltransferase/class I SAM-dependent methyltransferase [Aquihabitans sp. G128]QXC60183.1 methyltransferase domain-containing protein [Aquihabitans sp. G128]
MKKIGVLVVAYNAATTLAQTLDRIPQEFRGRIHEVLVGDDHSQDSTYLVGLGYQSVTKDLPITLVRHPKNLGYGGNQKWGYRHAIDRGWDIAVLLHGDGQYAPEILDQMVAPIERGEAEAVFGSRMMQAGEARKGGMPAYKYVGNRILTTVQNKVVGTGLSEWHSGYRAYDVKALAQIPFEGNDDGFNFDTQIIIQLHEAQQRIAEIPIPTYYGDEICYVDGIKYAKDVARDVARYRAHKMGFGTGELAFASDSYELKDDADTSHGRVEAWLALRSPSRVLDLGCSDGSVGARLVAQGHEVVGVDLVEHKGVRERLTDFYEADLEQGIPEAVGDGFDVVLAADVLEHVRDPAAVLDAIKARLRPGGRLITSIPNFGHWYPRTRVALGRFDYDARGILDAGHLRFFTKRSFARLVDGAGWTISRAESIGLPLGVVERGASAEAAPGGLRQLAGRIDRGAVALRPQLFAYQFLYELAPRPSA